MTDSEERQRYLTVWEAVQREPDSAEAQAKIGHYYLSLAGRIVNWAENDIGDIPSGEIYPPESEAATLWKNVPLPSPEYSEAQANAKNAQAELAPQAQEYAQFRARLRLPPEARKDARYYNELLTSYYFEQLKQYFQRELMPALAQLAYQHYDKALLLGLKQKKDTGYVHYLYAAAFARRFGSEAGRGDSTRILEGLATWVTWKPSPLQSFHLRQAEQNFKFHLRTFPEDLDVLGMLGYVYADLGQRRKQGETEALMKQIRAGKELGNLGAKNLTPLAKEDAGETWQDFENKCLLLVKAMGFHAQQTTAGADGGIDIVAMHSQPLLKGKYIIQCKHWSNPVGEPVLRDLYGLVISEQANKGIVMTNSTFTEAARRFAEGKTLELIDGLELHTLLEEHNIK